MISSILRVSYLILIRILFWSKNQLLAESSRATAGLGAVWMGLRAVLGLGKGINRLLLE